MIDERRAARPTAYVLGEMTAEEKQAFELEMSESAELRAEVSEVREMASLLSREMAGSNESLPAGMRAKIESAAAEKAEKGGGARLPSRGAAVIPSASAPKRRSLGRALGMAGGFAAALAAAGLFLVTRSEKKDTAEVAYAPVATMAPQAYATAASPAQEAPRPMTVPTEPLGNGRMAGDRARDAQRSGDRYESLAENPFLQATTSPLSTFSIDVDTASYSLVRSHLQGGSLPPSGAVRIEEMINYFDYEYSPPSGDVPFRVQLDLGVAPWAPDHQLVRVAIKGKSAALANQDGVNLVFLVDTSGSMEAANKLPLLKAGFRKMVDKLGPNDRVAIVSYAGSAGLVLPSTPVRDKDAVLSALDRLSAGGSTNGGAGIDLAYKVASENFLRGGVNRVLLATDGDFNVGTTSQDALVDLIQAKARTGVFLSVLGFGRGNFNDALLEKIADKGNGQYAYIDNLAEAQRALVDGLGSLVTIAKDVKIQVEWNPAEVASYRLLGYENRVMAARDFNDDRKDAGELGAGHTVTALYEIVPAGGGSGGGLKYQPSATAAVPGSNAAPGELLTIKLRYKEPDGAASKLIEQTLSDRSVSMASMSGDFKLAAAVAGFGMLLRGSPNAGNATYDSVQELAESAGANDEKRRELIGLIQKAKALAPARRQGGGDEPR